MGAIFLAGLAAIGALVLGYAAPAQAGPSELAVINQAADALGGRQQVLDAKSLTIIGYGQGLTRTAAAMSRAPSTRPKKR